MSLEPNSSDTYRSPQEIELQDCWPALTPAERFERFCLLPPSVAAAFFSTIEAHDQAEIVRRMFSDETKVFWLRLLAPDDVADVMQEVSAEERSALLALLDQAVRSDVESLLTYAEDHAGGLMSPRFARVRMDMSRDEALNALRRQAQRQLETPYYVYVVDRHEHLLGVVSFWELFAASAHTTVRDLMCTEVITVTEAQDQEAVAAIIAQCDLLAVPVVDEVGRIKGIVTVDDIVDVMQEEATEDMQKLAAMEVFDLPYLRTSFGAMLKKRAGWLAVLFVGELLTATAMGYYEGSLARAVVLGLFVPLIISSGGNAGSQASTLMVRALALGDVRLRDVWRVIRRESLTGLALGVMLGGLGLGRILLWQELFHTYGGYAGLIIVTVGLSLIGVVLWGTMIGSMLPFLLRRLSFNPASASAPLVATLVDVTGLIIYFSVASLILRGTLL